jgi:hypothetical protein
MHFADACIEKTNLLIAFFTGYITTTDNPSASTLLRYERSSMITRALPIFLSVFLACSACAESRKSEWRDIDYSNVYRSAGQRQIDNNYQQPSVVGCVNDDLYLCK